MHHVNSLRLKAERKRRGWSQAKVAEALGVSPRTVRRWEKGIIIPYPYYSHKLCVLFGKTAAELGLVPDADENDVAVEVSISLTQIAASVVLADPTIPQGLESTNSLLGRDSLFIRVKQSLLQGSSLALMARDSLPGIGQTTLAVALTNDQEVQTHFHDGILWAGLGPQPNVLGVLAHWGKLLGVVPSKVADLESRAAWSRALQTAIGTRRLLLVIDDAQKTEDVLALQIGGPECCYLLTTRLSQVAFMQQQIFVVPQLEDADAMALLAREVPQLVQQDPQGAGALLRAVDGLPLALSLLGRYLASRSFPQGSQPLQIALAHLHDTEHRLGLSLSSTPEQNGANLVETMPLCLLATVALCEQQLSPQAHASLCSLANVFEPKPHSFSEEAALAVIQQPLEILDELCDTGLLESCGLERYTFHQIVSDYARVLAKVPSAHQQPDSSLESDVHIHEQETCLSADGLFFHRSLRSIGLRMWSTLISRLLSKISRRRMAKPH
ncbi:MAG TPA: NB-ARC domain-containing protein [Ktedonobacteraceae bacterium]|nr:NB-ARC domain-containing protein [Ktedonobacteraceae bacterium]